MMCSDSPDTDRRHPGFREANAELLRKIEELSLLRRLGDRLATRLDLAEACRTLVDLVSDEFQAETVRLLLRDPEGSDLRLRAQRQAAEDECCYFSESRAAVWGDQQGIVGRVLRSGRPVHVSDVEGACPAAESARGPLLFVPLKLGDEVRGVLSLARTDGEFTADEERLLEIVANSAAIALENARLYTELRQARDALARENVNLKERLATVGGQALVGASPAFREMVSAIEKLASVEATVLILGESGTGKELVARSLHERSRRRTGPLVALNCAALPESLLEAELFGIEKGVATGVDQRSGRVEQAHGGTLFLDEIGDMQLSIQAKILRVLEAREVVRVGGRDPIPVDVRVLAATHRDLEREVAEGRFRADLYYRLKVLTLRVPSLRERREDVPLLVRHFVRRLAEKHHRPLLRISPAAMTFLVSRPWPGNVRELANVVEQAVVLAEGSVLGPEHFGAARSPEAGATGAPSLREVEQTQRARLERELILQALAEAANNRTRAARLLGIGRRTLLYKLKQYGIGSDQPLE